MCQPKGTKTYNESERYHKVPFWSICYYLDCPYNHLKVAHSSHVGWVMAKSAWAASHQVDATKCYYGTTATNSNSVMIIRKKLRRWSTVLTPRKSGCMRFSIVQYEPSMFSIFILAYPVDILAFTPCFPSTFFTLPVPSLKQSSFKSHVYVFIRSEILFNISTANKIPPQTALVLVSSKWTFGYCLFTLIRMMKLHSIFKRCLLAA